MRVRIDVAQELLRAALQAIFAGHQVVVGSADTVGAGNVAIVGPGTAIGPEPTVLLTWAYEEKDVLPAVLAGYAGIVSVQDRVRDIVAAVEAAATGRGMSPAQTAAAINRARELAATSFSLLSGLNETERHVLALLADGRSNREIADQLGLAVGTVKNTVSHILSKLHVPNRTSAALLWRAHEPDTNLWTEARSRATS